MFETDADALTWMHERMFLNFDSFTVRADRLDYGETVVVEHKLHHRGTVHFAHAPCLREALSYARQALHAWAPWAVAPERDSDDDWLWPKRPGATRGHPRVELSDADDTPKPEDS